MKAAIVLSMETASPEHQSIEQKTGEINARLETILPKLTCLELWLFYKTAPPKVFPEINGSLSAVRLIPLDHDHLPESYLHLLSQLFDQTPMDLMLFASDGLGKELATRLACRLNGSSCLQVRQFCLASGKIQVKKPVYGNNLTATFILEHPPYCLSMAKQPCSLAKMIPLEYQEILTLDPLQCHWGKERLTIADPPDTGLATADLVLVVGQGAKNKETVDLLQGIATAMGAKLGASRPVVMNAWTDMNRLIGTSGLILSPKLCIAAGVSGTAVFAVGIQASDLLVAINTDRSAPIFQMAHVGIVGELQPLLQELEKIIVAERAKRRFTRVIQKPKREEKRKKQ